MVPLAPVRSRSVTLRPRSTTGRAPDSYSGGCGFESRRGLHAWVVEWEDAALIKQKTPVRSRPRAPEGGSDEANSRAQRFLSPGNSAVEARSYKPEVVGSSPTRGTSRAIGEAGSHVLDAHGLGVQLPHRPPWGASSSGRARRWQRRGAGFESPALHRPNARRDYIFHWRKTSRLVVPCRPHGSLAQCGRALPSHGRGRRFDPGTIHRDECRWGIHCYVLQRRSGVTPRPVRVAQQERRGEQPRRCNLHDLVVASGP